MTQSWLEKKMEELFDLIKEGHEPVINHEEVEEYKIKVNDFFLSLLQDFAKEVRLEEIKISDCSLDPPGVFLAGRESAKRELDQKIKRLKNMQLEKQVVSLELAKRLKELGVKQESLFYWQLDFFKKGIILPNERACVGSEVCFSAFTVAELGEMLPKFVLREGVKFEVNFEKNNIGDWFVSYTEWSLKRLENYELLVNISADTEADARAKMLIFLIENNLLKD